MNRRDALAGLGLAGSAWLAGTPALLSAQRGQPALRILTGQLTQGGWARGIAAPGVALAFQGNPVATDARGDFLIAFDRDAEGTATIVGRDPHGRDHPLPLTISPRAWKIERVPVGPRPGGTPSEAFRIRRERELAQIVGARALETGAGGWKQQFIWPAKGRISGRFGSQRIYNGVPGSYHSGLDIATGASGTPFVAPADGTVILAADRQFSLEGNLLMLDHGMNLNSAFLHCSKLLVGLGEKVRQGQVIGHIGATGRATGPHLHWSIKWREARLDPLLFLPAA
jgi:hypothetical protein